MCLTGMSMENSISFPMSKNTSIFRVDHPYIFAILTVYDYTNVAFIGRVVRPL